MNDQRQVIRTMVRSIYDIQKIRIMSGNRITMNFKSKLGQKPSQPEEELDEDAQKILADLRRSYKKITEGVKRFPKQADFVGDELITSYAELALVAQYDDMERGEKLHFSRLEEILQDYPIYPQYLSKIKGIGPAMSGVLVSEIDIHRATYASSIWMYCFPAGTYVQTPAAALPIEKLQEGQHVVNAQGEVGTIMETMHRSYTGPLVTLKVTGCLPLSCTPEHPLFVSRQDGSSPQWIAAGEVRAGDYLHVPKCKMTEDPTTPNLHWHASTYASGKNPLLQQPLPLTEETLYLFGRFVADGAASLWEEAGQTRGTIQIVDGKEQLPDLLRLKEIVEEHIGSANLRETSEGYRLSFGRATVAERFSEWFGRGAANKHLPDWLMGLSERELLVAFLRGYLHGDGCVVSAGKSQGTIMASSASRGLILQLQLLLTKLDLFATVHCVLRETTVGVIRGREFNQQRERYVLNLPTSAVTQLFPEIEGKAINRTARKMRFEQRWYLRVTAIESSQVENRMVYNLRVSNGNTYLANNLIVHNCGLDVAADGKGRSMRKEHLVTRTYLNKDKEEKEKQSITFNPFLKSKLLGVLGPSLLRAKNDYYTEVYQGYKHRLESQEKYQEDSKGHRHNMALRYVVKRFLADLYEAWRPLEGLPVHNPYAEAKLGIKHHGGKTGTDG
jgi:Intein splicing domain/LAGLIDADG-like domain